MERYFCEKENTLSTLKLANLVGINESIVLQKVHHLTLTDNNYEKIIKPNERWIRISYRELGENIPFFSRKTTERIVKKLEQENALISNEFNEHPMDKTKWYTVNYKKILF